MSRNKIAFLMLLLAASPLFGYQFSLQKNRIDLSSGSNSVTGILSNAGSKTPIALTIVPKETIPSGNTLDSKRVDTTELIIIPNKSILLPNQEKVITITWNGPLPKHERLFYLNTEEIEIPSIKKRSSVSFQLDVKVNFEKRLYVGAKKFRSDVDIEMKKEYVDGLPKLVLWVHNKGKASKVIKGFSVHMKTDEKKVVLPSELFNGGTFRIFPKHSTKMVLAWPSELSSEARIKKYKYKTKF